jgi:hypothetical protein
MAGLTLLVFRQYLFSRSGDMLLGQDTIAAGIMFRKFFVEHMHATGRLPLWNPYLFGGVPTVEAGSGDILYPPSLLLHLLLPLTSALAWKLILHVYLAGVFMYLAARALNTRRYIALFAGSAYLLSTNLVSLVWGGQDGKMYVIALFPGALWLLITAIDRRSWVRFLWLGVIAGFMVVAHPQLAYYAYLSLGAYALGSLWGHRREGGARLANQLAGSMVAAITALGVAAVVLLPMYRYLREDSPRAGPGRGFEYSATWSLHAEELTSLLIPEFSGTDVQSETYWGKNPFKHNSEYGGALILALGVAALVGLRGDRRRWGLGSMVAVSLLYALGAGTPFFRLVYSVVPGMKNFRAPSLATFVAIAALTLLAALLLEQVLVQSNLRARRAAMISLIVATGLALLIGALALGAGPEMYQIWGSIFGRPEIDRAGPFSANLPRLGAGALLIALACALAWSALYMWSKDTLRARSVVLILLSLTALDLLRVDSRYIQVVRYDDFFPADPGIEALRDRLVPGERVLSVGGVYQEGYLATYGVPEVFGYHGNQIRWYNELTRFDVRQSARTASDLQQYWLGFLNSGAFRALAARYVLLPGQVDLPGFRLLGSDQRVAVYVSEAAMPGAAVVPQLQVEPDSARRIALLWSPTFDPSKTAIVEQPVLSLGQAGGTGTATITGNSDDTMAIRVHSTGPALLAISRTYHPSWQAEIDGVSAPVLRANHALMGVPLPRAGDHNVVLRYHPAIVYLAATISAATWGIVLVASAIALALARRQQRG